MQDPPPFPQLTQSNFTFPEQEQLKCPRCDSSNTKFCYYNNYNLSQPRHFCKNCRRYWTKGGALRNIPVGGGTRKNNTSSKRSSSSSSSPSSSDTNNGAAGTSSIPNPKRTHIPNLDPDPNPNPNPNPNQNHHHNNNNNNNNANANVQQQQQEQQNPVLIGLGSAIEGGQIDNHQHHNHQGQMNSGGFISMFGSLNNPTDHQHQQQIGNLNFLHGLGGGPIPSRFLSVVDERGYPIPAGFNLEQSTAIRDNNNTNNSDHPELQVSNGGGVGVGDMVTESFYPNLQQLQQNGWPGLTINTNTTTPPSSGPSTTSHH